MVCIFEHIGIMRGKNERRFFNPVHLFHQVEDLVAGNRIEVRRRLISKNNIGIGDESAGNGDTLALSAGKFCGPVMFMLCESDFID